MQFQEDVYMYRLIFFLNFAVAAIRCSFSDGIYKNIAFRSPGEVTKVGQSIYFWPLSYFYILNISVIRCRNYVGFRRTLENLRSTISSIDWKWLT